MYSLGSCPLWPLSATVLAGLLYPAWRISQSGRRALRDSIPSASQPSVPLQSVPDPAETQTHTLKWISVSEFMALLAKFNDLIVIDLREDAQWTPFSASIAVFVLPVKLYELVEVLERVPSDRVVVFYGVSDLSMLMIKTSSRMKGSAPLYVLDGDLDELEAA